MHGTRRISGPWHRLEAIRDIPAVTVRSSPFSSVNISARECRVLTSSVYERLEAVKSTAGERIFLNPLRTICVSVYSHVFYITRHIMVPLPSVL